MIGGDTNYYTTSNALPERAVVVLTTLNASNGIVNQCTGTVVQRGGTLGGITRNGRVLTAAHCFCDPQTDLLTGVGANTNVVISRVNVPSLPLPGSPMPPNIVRSQHVDAWVNSSIVCGGFPTSDLAIVTIGRPFTPTEFPEVPRVYTGGDFMDRVNNVDGNASELFPPNPRLFSGGRLTPTYGSTWQVQRGTMWSLIFVHRDDRELGIPWIGQHIRTPQEGLDYPITEGGDSGGPLTFGLPPARPTIFGVCSGTYSLFNDYTTFTPTWDNLNLNGAFIRSILNDADEDGVDDSVDNLPPSMCDSDPYLCSNPDQADGDGDGVGDKRDNCPPSVCVARGLSAAACANPTQADWDKDGTGDVCDSCPYKFNGDARIGAIGAGGQNDDEDGDRVGDACDNCGGLKNGYRACHTNSDCPAGGICLGTGGYGKCGGPGGESCASTLECPIQLGIGHYTCAGLGTWGHCDIQLDSDGDKIGDACDGCPGVGSTQVTTNSNVHTEIRQGVDHRGDMCDEVPQLATRGNWGRIKYGTNTNLDPAASTTNYTTFLQSSGVGVGALPTSATETADMRFCHCVSGIGEEILEDDCRATQCAPTDNPLSMSNWHQMTTSVATTLTVAPPIPTTYGTTISSLYTSAITCNDTFTHRPVSDVCRLGSERLLRWDHVVDMNRDPGGFEKFFSDGYVEHTAGLVLSHVRTTTPTHPTRDLVGGIRDTYEHVKTPLVRYVSTLGTQAYTNCILAGCNMVFRPDWLIFPPDTYRTQLTPIDDLNFFARISLQPGGAFGAVSRPTDPVLDLTGAIAPDVADLLNAPDWGFLTPVESGATARAQGNSARPIAVAITSPWRASSYRPWGVRVFEDGVMWLAPFQELPPPPPSDHPFGETRFIPSDRDGAKALYSADDLAVFLVGGHHLANTELTREVWRYDLRSDTWTNLLRNVVTEATIQEPRALAFDSSTQTLVAIDQVNGATTRRIVRIDLKSKIVRVVAQLPKYAPAGRYSLVHAGSGQYLLLRQDRSDNHFDIFRFSLQSSAVSWLGRRAETGDLLDDAFATPLGVLAPITREPGGQHDFVVIGTSPNTNTPSAL